MNAFRIALSATFAALVLSACDGPGTAPSASEGGGGPTIGSATSNPPKTATPPTDTGKKPEKPTPQSGKLLDTAALLGPVVFPAGGSVRRLSVFLEADRTVHVWATSDGTKSGSYDRQTTWRVDIASDSSLKLDWVTNGEAPYRSTLWSSDSGRSWSAELLTLANAHEFRIRGPKGALVAFAVHSASDFRPANWEVGWSPTGLSDAETTGFLTMGLKQTSIGTNVFRIRLP